MSVISSFGSPPHTDPKLTGIDWQDIATNQGLLPHICFNHTFRTAAWQPSTQDYSIAFSTPDEVHVRPRILVSSIGGFSKPLYPTIKGMDAFKGRVFHSSRWPGDVGVEELRGKTIGVIGNGCSGCVLPPRAGKRC